MIEPSFPPLMTGVSVNGAVDPFAKACAMAAMGCDAGTVVHNITADRLMAALVMAPEVPLEEAMSMLPTCGVGFQNALGSLGPPEVAVHLEWSGGIRVNGAGCGRLRVMAGANEPKEEPGWLVIGLEVPLILMDQNPGDNPDQTALFDEGCAEVDPVQLLESWARHSLVWIKRWEEDGPRPLHAEWRGLAHAMGEEIDQNGVHGTFMGVDENFGMLLRTSNETRLLPLSSVLEDVV